MSQAAQLQSIYQVLRQNLAIKNSIENAKRREPADRQRLRDANEAIEGAMQALNAHIAALGA